MNRASQVLQVWRGIFTLLRGAAPLLSVAVIIVTVLEAIAGILVLYVLKVLVDTISSQLASQAENNFSQIVEALILTGSTIMVFAMLQTLSGVLRMRQGIFVSDHVDREIHDRAINVDLRFYESPQYYDALERARHGGSQRPANVVSNGVTMLSAALTLFAIFILLASIEWRLVPILAAPILLAVFVRLRFTKQLFDWRMSRAQLERRTAYLDWLMTSINHAKDLRINRIGGFLRDQFRSIRRSIRQGEIRIQQSRFISDFVFSVFGTIVFVVVSAWLLYQSLNSGRPIGDVVLFVLLIRRAETSGKQFIGNVSMIVDDHLYLQRLLQFLSVKPSIETPSKPKKIPNPITQGIEMSDVSFTYDGAKAPALSNINLTIRPNQIVALVGENGSGKTTLIKVMTRLYDPSDGRITLDGINVRDFAPEEYRKLMSVVFQDYSNYADTVEENIRYGDVNMPFSKDRVMESATNAGASEYIEALPQKYQTPLSKLFDNGQDLSIGQWQRLALARAFYARSKFVILDEPTSAVDPKAEFELFENFRASLGNRSAFVISHRLSTIRQADYTYVLEQGRIVESGTHDELVGKNGKYANLFEKQARNYR